MFETDTSEVEAIQAFKAGWVALQKQWAGELHATKTLIAALAAQEEQLRDVVADAVADQLLLGRELEELAQAKQATDVVRR